MKVGIVGSEGAKFTPETEYKARRLITQLLEEADAVVSGACHLGGIDIWAAEEARAVGGIEVIEFPPSEHSWANGYKPRNIRIARNSDVVHCITVAALPANYTGMRFEYCYHCKTNEHVKSGGCWTVKHARSLGKPGFIHVIN